MPLSPAPPPRHDPAWRGRLLAAAALVLALWPLVVATEFHPLVLLDARNLESTGRFLAAFLPPAHAPEFLAMVLRETWRTVAIATTGLALAMAAAVPMTLLGTSALSVSALCGRMARGPFWARQAVRGVLVVLRSVICHTL